MCDCEPVHPLTPREKVKLKPCPFCGSSAILERNSDHHGGWFNLGCGAPWKEGDACPGYHAFYTCDPSEETAAVAAWNHRAALASPGDHAELARLAEWRDRLRADPGRAAHFGSPYADKPMQNGRTYWNIDLADDITTLIAEVAALREDLNRKHEACQIAQDQAMENGSRAREAERKLAEADEENNRWLVRMADVREASGIGMKPMLSEVPGELRKMRSLIDRAADLMRQCTDPDRFERASTLNVYANMRAWLSDLSKEAERG